VPGFARVQVGPAGGTVWKGTVPGESAGARGRPTFVYLPPGYSPSRRYPVAYLLHGMPGGPTSYVYSLHLAERADALIASGRTRPFIAVCPPAGTHHGYYSGEWAGVWEDYLVRRVVPWVDTNLPTVASAAGRVLAGLSAGGFGAVSIGLRHLGVFGVLESWSGYFHPRTARSRTRTGPCSTGTTRRSSCAGRRRRCVASASASSSRRASPTARSRLR